MANTGPHGDAQNASAITFGRAEPIVAVYKGHTPCCAQETGHHPPPGLSSLEALIYDVEALRICEDGSSQCVEATVTWPVDHRNSAVLLNFYLLRGLRPRFVVECLGRTTNTLLTLFVGVMGGMQLIPPVLRFVR